MFISEEWVKNAPVCHLLLSRAVDLMDEDSLRAVEAEINYRLWVQANREKEIKRDNANQSTGQGKFVSTKPTVRTAHDLSFLISDKSGESMPVVVKDVDSKTLHDMLDIADEIVISRVDAK